MESELEVEPSGAMELCGAAHARLLSSVEGLTDEQARSPSRLPDWTIAHVLTHLARNADGHVRRLEAALQGKDVPRYPGGPAQRGDEIAKGARRSAGDVVLDLDVAQRRLEQVWEDSDAAGWSNGELRGHDTWPTTGSPVRRLREVEMHHVDLGMGYEPSDWPGAYVAWELPMLLATVPSRVRTSEDARQLVTWLSGRQYKLPEIDLAPW